MGFLGSNIALILGVEDWYLMALLIFLPINSIKKLILCASSSQTRATHFPL